MAITRCPYCHAITDENDKYCNNCGTQLLFSEDEEIEEEIPGEKIIDAEVEEKDYTVDEPEGEKRPAAAKDLETEIDEELEDEIPEETEELALEELVDEEVSEEVILVDQVEAAEAKAKDGSKPLDEAGPAAVKRPEPDALKGDTEEDEEEDRAEETAEEELADELEEEIEEELEEEAREEAGAACRTGAEDETREYAAVAPPDTTVPAAPGPPAACAEEPDIEYLSRGASPDQAATPGEAELRPATFDTRELEDLGKTVEMSKEKIDKFLEVMAEKKAPALPAAPEPVPEKTPEPPTGTLPPWASTMKGAPVFPEDTGPVEPRTLRDGGPSAPEIDEEVEIFPRRRVPDSTIGLPEKVSQAPLPFDRPAAEAEEAGEEGPEESEEEVAEEGEEGEDGAGPAEDMTPAETAIAAGQVHRAREPFLPVREAEQARTPRHEIEAAEEGDETGPRPPFNFSFFIKSKSFDILFVGLFWVVALWLAAYSMGMTLFDILGSMSGSMVLLYAVLVFLYFFLFKFFLGETLGDRLFRPRE